MRHLVFFLLLHLFPVSGWATTPVPNVSHAYFYDPQSATSIDAVHENNFTPYKDELNLGFKNGTIWVRLDITSTEVSQAISNTEIKPVSPLIIRAGPHYLDEITFYEKLDGKWSGTTVGDLFPNPSAQCIDDFHCYTLQGSQQQAQTVYLKIKSTGMLTLELEVKPYDALIFSALKRVRQTSISLTAAFALLVMGLIFYFRYRSKLLHIFCWFQVSIILFICARNGILAQLLPNWPVTFIDNCGHIIFSLRVFLHAALGREFISAYQTTSLYKKLSAVVFMLCGLSVIPIVLGFTNFALILNTSIFLCIPLVQIYGTNSTPDIPKSLRIILLIAYTLFFTLVALGLLHSTDLIPKGLNLISMRGIADMRLNGIVTSFFVFWIILLEQNNRDKIKANDIIKLRLDAAQAQANQEKLNDRNTLIDMLTHELKNPLGTITFAATSVKRKLLNDIDSLQRFKHIDLCITRMNKLIEHVARSSKIDRLHELGPVENIPAAALMHDLIEEYADDQRFILQIEDDLTFRANREMLTVIFENLISNAYKYAHAASAINISIHSELTAAATSGNNQNHICFSISNTAGVFGIPDENRLFERYYRHSQSQGIPGLGIGLSLVKAAAQKIGASVNYHHEYGLIIFTARIPN